MTEEQKNQQKVYEGLRDAQKITEVDYAPPVRNEAKVEEAPKEAGKEPELATIGDGFNVGSNLEELD